MALWLLVAVQALVAAASLVVEIVAGRMLAPYVGMSLYTWTSVIAVVLAGFSVGHWVGGWLADRQDRAGLAATGWALVGAAVTTALATFLLRAAAGPVVSAATGPVPAIVALTFAAFFLPSFFAGIPAPILAQIAVRRAGADSGRALGAMFAAGAVGAIVGTLAAGFVFIAWLGSIGTLAAVTVVYVALAAICFAAAARVRDMAALLVPLGLGLWSLTAANPCDVESRYFCIRVVDLGGAPGARQRMMVLDHLVHGGADEANPRAMLTPHAAMMEALSLQRMADQGRDRFRAFFVGGGTYSIPRSLAARGGVEMVVAEIDPEVARIAQDRFWADPAGWRNVEADARVLLTREAARYDVVIGDAFTDIAVPAHLITQEFFELVHGRLTPGGVYIMNVIDTMESLEVMGAMLRTARAVWPVVEIWVDPAAANSGQRVFILVAGDSPTGVSRVGPDGRVAARVGPATLAAIAERGAPLILRDDYAPIDRLIAPANVDGF